MRNLLLATTAAGLCVAVATVAQAQTVPTTTAPETKTAGLESVTVTAERRKSSVQKVPATIMVRSGALLRDQGRTTISQMLEDVPNVTINTGNLVQSGAPTDNPATAIIIRGVPTQGGGPGQVTVPGAAYYVDGIYGGIGGDTDLDRLEVLEGPQGTLYGRSATSGVISVFTRDPVLNKLSGTASVELGSYSLRHEQAAVNIPVTDQVALRVSGSEYDVNGVTSTAGGSSHIMEARAKLLFQPNADLKVLVGAAYEQDGYGSGGAQLQGYVNQVNGWQSAGSDPIFNQPTRRHQYWAQADWTTPYGTLTYLPAFHNYVTSGDSIPVFFIEQVQTEPLDQFASQEARFTSLAGSPVEWTVGGLFYDNRVHDDILPHYIPIINPTFSQYQKEDTRDIGGFAEATYPLPFLPKLKLTAGARYDSSFVKVQESLTQYVSAYQVPPGNPLFGTDETGYTGSVSGSAGTTTASNVTYKLRASYDITPTDNVYLTTATGYLPGSTNVAQGPNNTVFAERYGQERLTSYELGTKNRLFDNTLQVNGDVFYYNYAGYQQGVNLGGKFPGDPPDNVILTTPARMDGFELELLYLVTANDKIGFDMGHLDSKFVNPSVTFTTYLANKSIPGVAGNSLSANFTHTMPLADGSTLSFYDQVRFTAHSVGGIQQVQVDNGGEPYVTSPAELIDDVSGSWTSADSKYSVTLYVHNVGNEVYNTGGINNFSAATTDTPAQIQRGVSLTPPRTFGIVLNGSF